MITTIINYVLSLPNQNLSSLIYYYELILSVIIYQPRDEI